MPSRPAPKVLVCGSLAIDHILKYKGSFADYQDKYQIQALNISLQLTDYHTCFGGCGMNITYGLAQLGVDCLPLSAAGLDFNSGYRQHLESHGINSRYIAIDSTFEHSAHCTLISDPAGNQITGFYSGAAASSQRLLPSEIEEINTITLAILAPEDAEIMLRQARNLSELGVPVIFDPGQGIEGFSQEQIQELLQLSRLVMVNSHEYDILLTNSRLAHEDLLKWMDLVIVTRGANGVDLYQGADNLHVDAVSTAEIVDPTGCGDAFRAGFICGLVESFAIRECAQMGCIMAAESLCSPDPQRYQLNRPALLSRRQQIYGDVSKS
jgi:adenosine kinase